MATLILIRGLPGTDKTKLIEKYKEKKFLHFDVDMYIANDNIEFDTTKLLYAHYCCLANTADALKNNSNVVVSNTFNNVWEMRAYLDLGYQTKIITVPKKLIREA